jgi:hypothetical protein
MQTLAGTGLVLDNLVLFPVFVQSNSGTLSTSLIHVRILTVSGTSSASLMHHIFRSACRKIMHMSQQGLITHLKSAHINNETKGEVLRAIVIFDPIQITC